MKQRLNTGACVVLSLLFCLTVISWARSYVSAEAVALSRRIERFSLVGSEGRVVLGHGKLHFATPDVWERWRRERAANVHMHDWSFTILNDVSPPPALERSVLGLGAQRWEAQARRDPVEGVTWRRTIIQAPYWAIALLTGTWPAWWLWKLSKVRGERAARGLCRHCGFDLAGVYYSCPKCGQRLPLPAFDVVVPAK